VAKRDATELAFKAPVFIGIAEDSEHFVRREHLSVPDREYAGKTFSGSSHGDTDTFRRHSVKRAVDVLMNISMIDWNIGTT